MDDDGMRARAAVPQRFVVAAERMRRRETVTEQRVRREAPSPAAAASALLLLWRHPDRFPALARAARIERAFRQRHPRLQAATVVGAVITPLTADASIPAGASDAYVVAAQIGAVGLVSWTTITIMWSALALSRMAGRREVPATYPIVQEWTDRDIPDPGMNEAATALTVEYVRLRNAAPGARAVFESAEAARVQLRHLALITRKHAAARAATAAARSSGDSSTALVPAALADDLAAQFDAHRDLATQAVAALGSHTATAIAASKMRALTLPDPTST